MATNQTLKLSASERQYILDGIRDNIRADGRSRNQFRQYTIVTGQQSDDSVGRGPQQHREQPALILSNGSARVFFASGATHIICSVKAELSHPSPEKPTMGQFEIHVDSLTSAASRRKTEEDNNHLKSILSALLVTHLLDLEALCIAPGYAWKLNVDLLVLSGTAANLVDPCSHVIQAALQQTLLPNVSPTIKNTTSASIPSTGTIGSISTHGSAQIDLLLESDIAQARPPPGIDKAPIVVTVTVCQAIEPNGLPSKLSLLLDATVEEQACSYCQVHVAIDANKVEPTICSLRKTGEASLPFDMLQNIIDFAINSVPKAKEAFQTSVSTLASPALLQEQFAIQ